MTGLQFDEASHTYSRGGVLVPGVTSILAPLTDFSFVRPDVLEAASQFGKAVHRACELWDLGALDIDTLDAPLAPYLAGWRKFSDEWGVSWEMVEGRVYSETHNYAGTLDRFGKLTEPGKLKGPRPAVVDIKSSAALYPAVGPQLAAYKNAIPNVIPTTDRIAVQLFDDGTYVAKTYTDRDDWSLFLSLLTLKQWCNRHSITPNFNQRK